MDSKIRSGLEKAGVPRARHHLFFCLGPECCKKREGEMLWDYVKKRVKDTGIPLMRTKADCFRICTAGPLLVVYPEGVWYGHVTPPRFERILREHIVEGRPIREWALAENCLGCRAPSKREREREDSDDEREKD